MNGHGFTFTKYLSFYTSNDIDRSKVKETTIHTLQKAEADGFDNLLAKHSKVFKKRWSKADVKLEGDNDALHALRFNIYHLLISAGPQPEV